MSSSTQYYRRQLIRATVRSPSEVVTVNPTKIFQSFKKTFGLSIVTILPRLDALEAKGSTRSTLKLCFRYFLVLRSPIGMVNENITIVHVRLVLRHQGGLRPVWSSVLYIDSIVLVLLIDALARATIQVVYGVVQFTVLKTEKNGRLRCAKMKNKAITRERKLFSEIPQLKTFVVQRKIGWYVHFISQMYYVRSRVVTDRQTDRQTEYCNARAHAPSVN